MANRIEPEPAAWSGESVSVPVAKADKTPEDTHARRRVAVIGGGPSGLVSTYLLEADYDVTLFEKGERVGGHADTHLIQKDGRTIALVENAADFFPSEKYYEDFFRLLDILGIGLYEQKSTICYFQREKPNKRGLMVLPPPILVNGTRMAASLEELGKAIALFKCLVKGQLITMEGDVHTTMDQVIQQMAGDAEHKAVMYNLLNGMYAGPSKAASKTIVASDVFCFTGEFLTKPLTSTVMHVSGGLQAYVKELVSRLKTATVKVNSPVDAITRQEDGRYQVSAAGQLHGDFDTVIVASEVVHAQALLKDLPAARAQYDAISQVTGAETRVAIHSDTSFLAPDRRDWSTVNIYPDGDEVVTTEFRDWQYSVPDIPVFKSWVTHSSRMPAADKMYRLGIYWHPTTDRAYFEAQGKLAPVNGMNDIWVAGLYTNGFATHNSAVCSAIHIAKTLAPNAPRLHQLLERPGGKDRGLGSSCCGGCCC